MSKWDDLIARLSLLGAPSQKWGTMEAGRRLSDYPKSAVLLGSTPQNYMPPAGTDIWSLQSQDALGAIAYPDDLADAARMRLESSPYQREPDGTVDWMYLRPQQTTVPDTPGRTITQYTPNDPLTQVSAVYDIAGDRDDLIPLLRHELRHGTNTPALLEKRAMRSLMVPERNPLQDVFSLPAESPSARVPSRQYQTYLARPSEMFSYITEAGDDYVRATGRLIESPKQAEEAMQAWLTSQAGLAGPAARQFYGRAYRTVPMARKIMNDMLMKYYAVPLAAGAASQMGDE